MLTNYRLVSDGVISDTVYVYLLMTHNLSSGTLNPTIPYHNLAIYLLKFPFPVSFEYSISYSIEYSIETALSIGIADVGLIWSRGQLRRDIRSVCDRGRFLLTYLLPYLTTSLRIGPFRWKVGNSFIFNRYLLRHLQWELATDH